MRLHLKICPLASLGGRLSSQRLDALRLDAIGCVGTRVQPNWPGQSNWPHFVKNGQNGRFPSLTMHFWWQESIQHPWKPPFCYSHFSLMNILGSTTKSCQSPSKIMSDAVSKSNSGDGTISARVLRSGRAESETAWTTISSRDNSKNRAKHAAVVWHRQWEQTEELSFEDLTIKHAVSWKQTVFYCFHKRKCCSDELLQPHPILFHHPLVPAESSTSAQLSGKGCLHACLHWCMHVKTCYKYLWLIVIKRKVYCIACTVLQTRAFLGWLQTRKHVERF